MNKQNQTKLIVENLNTVDVFLNTSSDIICIMDVKGRFKYVNNSFIEITKHLESELLIKTFFDFLDPKETLSISKKINSLSKENQKISFVSKYLGQNKLYKTITWKMIYLEKDNTLFTIGKDITEENTLAKEVENIKMALDESAIVAITNQKGIITYVNDKFCEISKFSRTELIGKDHKIINSGYHSKGFIKDLWQTIATGKIWKGEIKNLAKDGSHYWVDTTIVPFFNDKGKPIQYIAIRADITEKKKVEEDLIDAKKIAENSVRVKEEFLTNMSHEIRTPMNGIIGFTDLLLETNLNSEQNEFLDRIKKSSSTLLVLTNDILDLSKLESGKLLFENIKFDLIELIDQVIKMVEHSAKRKGIELSLYIDSKCPRHIKGDPTRLNQVLLNLINNVLDRSSRKL